MTTVTEEVKVFWNNFINKNPNLDYLKKQTIDAWSFGNTPEMADDLLALVLAGKKVATCCLLRAYRDKPEKIPRAGIYSIICNGNNTPKCIVFTSSTFICKFNEVSEELASEEGEGDQSLSYWQKVHREFFTPFGNFKEDEDLIFERFKVVYKSEQVS